MVKKKKFILCLILLLLLNIVFADIIPPVTSFDYNKSGNDYNLTLNCIDNNTGCKKINYNVNGEGWILIDGNYENKGIFSDFVLASTNKFNTEKIMPTQDFNITHVIIRTGGASDHKVSIWSSVANLPDTKLAETNVSNNVGNTTFTFTSSVRLLTDINYWIAIEDISGTNSRPYLASTGSNTIQQKVRCSGGSVATDCTGNYYFDMNIFGIGGDINSYNFTYSGTGTHTIQYFSTDNNDNNEAIKTSNFPLFVSTANETEAYITLTGASDYNGSTITNWNWLINSASVSTAQSFNYYTSANLDLNVCLNVIGINTNTTKCQNIVSWDNTDPTIYADANITIGFGQPLRVDYNLRCVDNTTPINYLITINDANIIYNSDDANNSTKTGTLYLNSGVPATLKFRCTDDANNYSEYTEPTIYPIIFRLINEQTGAPLTYASFTTNGIKTLTAYSYDGNYQYDFNGTATTSATFLDYSSIIRFTIGYNDDANTQISREIDSLYLQNDSNIGVCIAPFQTLYEQVFISSQQKPAVLYNDFANCYSISSTTKFAYESYLSTRAYTINKPYFLYTFTENSSGDLVKSLLVMIEGSAANVINLDTLEFNNIDYNISLVTDTLTIQPLFNSVSNAFDTNTLKIYYKSLENLNTSTTISIYDNNTNTLIWTYTETDTPNEFLVNFYYGDTNTNENTIFKINVTKNTGATTTTQIYYFNIFGMTTISETDFVNSAIIAGISLLFLLIALTMFSYRYSFGWLGIFFCLAALAITLFAVPTWYITFIRAIILIIMAFIGLIYKNETVGVN